jgi:hypothetical protein
MKFSRWYVLWGILAITACGGKQNPKSKPFSEFASGNLPQDVVWMIAPTALHTTLTDLGHAHFIAESKSGTIVMREQYSGRPKLTGPACAGVAASFASDKDPLADASIAALTSSPKLDAAQITAMNSNIGSFEPVNTQALWFLSNRLQLQIDAKFDKSVLSGGTSTGLKKADVTLVAIVVTLRFSPARPYVACLREGYQASSEFWDNFSRFQKAAEADGLKAKAVIYTGALIGELTGLTLGEVEFKNANDFSAGGAIGAQFSTDFTSENIRITIQQLGILSAVFSTKELLGKLQRRESVEALNYLRANTERMAIIAVIPEELPQSSANTAGPKAGDGLK